MLLRVRWSTGLLVVGLFAPTTPAAAAVPASERAALIALHGSTNGAGWSNDTGWLDTPGSECTWFGVECNDAGTAVRQLVLSNNQLSGVLPPQLGDLGELEVLALVGGQLTGAIPAQLGNLSQLLELQLSQNQLSGEIPATLGNLSQLVHLALSSNQLSGPIPAELADLEQLSALYLHSNQLRGAIPPELGGMSQLQYLFLSQNQLWGDVPTTFLGLTGLLDDAGLDLANNHLNTDLEPGLLAFLDAKQWGSGWTDFQTPATFCVPDASTLCITAHGGEWRARMSWQRGAAGGAALAVPLVDSGITQGGAFAFRNPTNPEVLLKILDFCGLGGASYAVFFAATTDAGFSLTVDDPATGASVVYTNPELNPAQPVQEVDTPFPCS